jgi:hypothetical protein
LCVALGVFSYGIFTTAGYVFPIPDLLIIGLFLVIAYLLAWVLLRNISSNKERIVETWGCGIISQTGRNEYTASGFSQPIVRIFKSIYRTKEDREATYFDKSQSLFKEGRAEIHLLKFFEEVLYQHASVFEAAVVGVPDDYWGEAVKGVIVLKEGITASEEEIIKFCGEHLAGYKKPKSIEFWKELPKNPTGKILKRAIREKYWKGTGRTI